MSTKRPTASEIKRFKATAEKILGYCQTSRRKPNSKGATVTIPMDIVERISIDTTYSPVGSVENNMLISDRKNVFSWLINYIKSQDLQVKKQNGYFTLLGRPGVIRTVIGNLAVCGSFGLLNFSNLNAYLRNIQLENYHSYLKALIQDYTSRDLVSANDIICQVAKTLYVQMQNKFQTDWTIQDFAILSKLPFNELLKAKPIEIAVPENILIQFKDNLA